MAEEYDLEAVIRYTVQGQAQVQQSVGVAQRQLDALRKSGAITDDQFQKLAKSFTQAGNAAQNKLGRAAGDVAVGMGTLNKATANVNTSLNSQRYALYDLATTYGVVSAALLGLSTVSIKTAADFESAFTGVERTLDPAFTGVADLRKELVNLSTTIPQTFQDISKIAQLGNQLGIAGDDVAGFTETVAQFSAVSGISVDETAQAFGRLQNLLGVSSQEFDRLGSSIALVGVNSAATEAQIIAIAKEIAPFTRSAGFGADGAIALSGALASLAVAPERARSAIQQFSTQLRKSVAEGGDSLNNFATLTGMTSEELDKLVRSGTDGDKIFRQFLETLSSGDPVQITQALDALNLSNLRVDTTIQALTQNLGVYDRAISDASKGYSENAELARQYAFVVDDLNSQFMLFVNSINALVATLSGGAASGLADLLATVTGLVNGFREFAEANQWVVNLAGAVIVLSTLVGVFTAFRTAQLLATASTYAFITAQGALKTQGVASGITGLIAALFGYTAAAEGATLATKAFRIALVSTGIGALLVGIGLAISLATDFNGTMQDLVRTFSWVFDGIYAVVGTLATFEEGIARVYDNVAKSIPAFAGLAQVAHALAGAMRAVATLAGGGGGALLKGLEQDSKRVVNMNAIFGDLTGAMSAATLGADDLSGGLGDVGKSAGGAAKQVRTLVDYANDLSSVFNRSFEIRFGASGALDTITTAWSDLNDEMDEYRRKVQELTADRAIKEYFLSVANSFGDNLRAGVLASDIADINAEIQDAIGKSSTELNGNSKAAITNRRRLESLTQNYQDYITALANSGADQATLNAAVDQATVQFTAQARALGYNTQQIQPYIAQLRSMTTVINAIPRNITVTANTNPALQALNEFAARATAAGASAGAGFAAGMNAGLARVARGQELQNEILKQQTTLAKYLQDGNVSGARYLGQYIAQLIAQLRSGSYASGGYTGRGGKYEPAGVVHRGEYVIPKSQVDQRTGRPYADALGNLQRGTRSSSYASGGFVGNGGLGVMELGPATRSWMRQHISNEVKVAIGDQVVAESASNGNRKIYNRGGGQ